MPARRATQQWKLTQTGAMAVWVWARSILRARHTVSPPVPAAFSGCVLSYVEEQADDWGFRHFQRDGKLYVDTRDDLGIFLIFQA